MHCLRRERRETHRDVLGPLRLGRAVAHPLPGTGDDRLSSPHVQDTVTRFYSEKAAEDHRHFLEFRPLPRFSQPAGEVMRATLSESWPELTRPTNSSIRFGLFPAATTMDGASISLGTRPPHRSNWGDNWLLGQF